MLIAFDKVIRAEGNTISDDEEELDCYILGMDYLENHEPLTNCGGFSITNAPFVHLSEGKYSTACGMTIEIAQEMSKAL